MRYADTLSHMSRVAPQIFVIAGPNGAGKSTSATTLLPETLRVEQFVNADLIAVGLSPFAPHTTAFAAGRIMLHRIRDLYEKRTTFAFETTLATNSYAQFLRRAQSDGYLVHVLYIALRSAALAISRVRARVQRGGHDVPEDVIVRRFARGLVNFFNLYKPLADSWTLCDNSGTTLTVVATGVRDDQVDVRDQSQLDSIMANLKHATKD